MQIYNLPKIVFDKHDTVKYGSYSLNFSCQFEETPFTHSLSPHTYLSPLPGAVLVHSPVAALSFFPCSSLSLLFHSLFPGNWVWLLVGSKGLGWSCWELCVCVWVCTYASVCAGKWANKGRWSMKGLEQRHSQLPNAWTRPQGPRSHILSLTYPHIHINAYTSFTYTWRRGSGGHSWELCVWVWVGVDMRVMESGDLLNCCHFWQICATQVERFRLCCSVFSCLS